MFFLRRADVVDEKLQAMQKHFVLPKVQYPLQVPGHCQLQELVGRVGRVGRVGIVGRVGRVGSRSSIGRLGMFKTPRRPGTPFLVEWARRH